MMSKKMRNSALGLLAFAAMGIQSTGAMMDPAISNVPVHKLKQNASAWLQSHKLVEDGALQPVANKQDAAFKDQIAAEIKKNVDDWIQTLRGGDADAVLVAPNRVAVAVPGALPGGGGGLPALAALAVGDLTRGQLRTYMDAVLTASTGLLPGLNFPAGAVGPRHIAALVNEVEGPLSVNVHNHALALYNGVGAVAALDPAVRTVADLVAAANLHLIEDDANAGVIAALAAIDHAVAAAPGGKGLAHGNAVVIADAVTAFKANRGTALGAAQNPAPGHGGGGAVLAAGAKRDDFEAALTQALQEENADGISAPYLAADHTAQDLADAIYHIANKK